MIYLFYGPNTHKKNRRVQELGEGVRSGNPEVALYSFDCTQETFSFDILADTLRQQGLFSEGKRMLVCRNLFELDEKLVRDVFARADSDPRTILFDIEEWKQETPPKYARGVLDTSAARLQFCAPYSAAECRALVRHEAARLGVISDSAAEALLVDFYSDDPYGLETALRTAAMYGGGLTVDAVRRTHEDRASIPLFHLSRAFSSGSYAQQLPLFERVRAQGADPFMLFSYLAKASSDSEAIAALAQADVWVKAGKMDMELALLTVLLTKRGR